MTETIQIALPEEMPPWRARYILGQALAYAIATIDGLPEKARAASDRDDMVALMLSNFDEPNREVFIQEVEVKTGHASDMTDWKASGL